MALVTTIHSSPLRARHGVLLNAVDESGCVLGRCEVEVAWLSGSGSRLPAGHAEGSQAALLSGLVVEREVRSLGLGKKLVKSAEAHAADWGCELCLHVASGNAAAQALYKSCGFEQQFDVPETLLSRLTGGNLAFFKKSFPTSKLGMPDSKLGMPLTSVPNGAAISRTRRSAAVVMRLPDEVSEALPWDDSKYDADDVEALWLVLVEIFGSEERALAATRQVRAQIICPLFANPALLRASRDALVDNLGEDEATLVIAKNPCVLTCGEGLRTADPSEIKRLAEVRKVLDSIPPEALLGSILAVSALLLAKIIAIKLGYSDYVFTR